MNISKALGQAHQLPVYSLNSQRALKLINRPNTSLKDLAQTIGADQSLSVKLLRIVNSAAFALPRTITRISEAIPYIGIEETRKVILAASAQSLFGGAQNRDTWVHALASAHIAEALHRLTNFGQDSDDAFMGGLLHDIGKTYLQKQYPSMYQKVFLRVRDGMAPGEAEEAEFGMDHARVGGEMLLHWNFAPQLREAVANHHCLTETTEPLTFMVALANQIAHFEDGSVNDEPDSRAMAFFGLDPERALEIKKSVSLAIERFEQKISALY
ncbi:MAG TPA: HDOD domain-containing protein [Anaerolineaceae bacterium]|nr:HDOD domain-containing protein [Anaerolineaceae bacterium]